MAEYSLLTSILCKISFFALASTMVYYWIRLFFNPSFEMQREGGLENNFFQKNDIGFFGVLTSNFSLTLLLLSRWFESRHFPFSNLFESLLLLCWTLTAIQLALGFVESLKGFYSLLGVLLSPLALFTNAFATFSLPEELQQSTVLVPALQSNWLAMHVSVMILSYGFLLSGSLLALAYLLLHVFFSLETPVELKIFPFGSFSFNRKDRFLENSYPDVHSSISTQTLSDRKQNDITNRNQLSNTPPTLLNLDSKTLNLLLLRLDNGSYRCIGLGFAFLTLGILSGAVWANEAWGSYWNWDPKETWALVTWIIFALYLHVRLNKGWQGEKPAYVAIFGFLSVWLCYLGVNLLGVGLHSYGWLS
jgi:cytochrome c-type biogenesis protein CcsB